MPSNLPLPVDLYGDIAKRLAELEAPAPRGIRKWSLRDAALLAATVLACLATVMYIPNFIYDFHARQVTYALGILAAWRYGWWLNHARRARAYGRRVWPRLARRRDAVWNGGWRPGHLHVQMTTFREEPAITRHVIEALVAQIAASGIPATIWVGTGDVQDERTISDLALELPDDLDIEIAFVRQNQPGKRMAIGLIMRAIIRTAPDPDDLIVFMDGDTVFGTDTLAKCCAMFGADPKLEALTTNEEAITYGPGWMRRWLDMRFAQRRLAMQSHVMSNKVLTLTGRMSMFRARRVTNEDFVRTIEADYLDHWLWGRFRFLSGDDKSTWYYLLREGAKMGYVPDALVYTVEIIRGSGYQRMLQNLRRWSGNMLRNGARALQLGPRRVGPFIWWCVLDQRIAIWTMLVSPALIVLGLILHPGYIVAALLWVVVSRLLLSLMLFSYARRVDMTWPFLLYANQVANSLVKSVLIFFPHKQTWANRGGQKAAIDHNWIYRAKTAVATFQYVTTMLAFFFGVAWLMGRTATFGGL